VSYFPPHLKCVTTLPCEIQKKLTSALLWHEHTLRDVCAVPLIHCVIDDTLSQAKSDLRQMLL